MPRIQDIKILDLEDCNYFDRTDTEQKNPIPGLNVTYKFLGEKRSNVATLKKEHLEIGVHRVLDDARVKNIPVTLNLGAMGNGSNITWFFPSIKSGGVLPVIQSTPDLSVVSPKSETKPLNFASASK
jgi:hypothetical protein